jgi:long-subunit acyl-CoA synthetase (AMP-forming)
MKEIQERLSEKIEIYEIPKLVHIMREPFSIQNDLLTLKYEPKRNTIIKKYNEKNIPLYK